MILYPAIDIRGGHAVRLLRGDYDHETAYDADPLDAARRWAGQGAALPARRRPRRRARGLAAQPRARAADRRRGRSADPGRRRAARRRVVRAALDAGAERAMLGTGALERPALVEELVAEHGERVVVSVDARGGRVAIAGWEQHTRGRARRPDRRRSSARGVARFVYTPVEVDGTMQGPGLAELEAVAGGDRGRADLLGRRRRPRRPGRAARRSGSRTSAARSSAAPSTRAASTSARARRRSTRALASRRGRRTVIARLARQGAQLARPLRGGEVRLRPREAQLGEPDAERASRDRPHDPQVEGPPHEPHRRERDRLWTLVRRPPPARRLAPEGLTSPHGAQARDPVPRRRPGPRRQGHQLRRHPRRRRPGRAGRALRRRGRRRARLPRHHRLARARETIVELARRTADNVFIPFTIGGGIRSVEDAQAVLDAGADKVSVNSAALARPELIGELADVFGAQCVVVAIDAKRREDGGWDVYVNGGRERTGARGGRLGARGGRARGRGDPADEHGPRRDDRRLRHRADARGRRRGAGAGDRLGRRRRARAPQRGDRGGRGGRRALRLDLPLRHVPGARREAPPRRGRHPVRIRRL